MPFVSESLIRALAEGLDRARCHAPGERRAAGSRAALRRLWPRLPPEPSPTSLAAGDLRAIGFHDRIRVGILPLEQVRALADPDLLFFNVNTADDLARADQLWRQRASSP